MNLLMIVRGGVVPQFTQENLSFPRRRRKWGDERASGSSPGAAVHSGKATRDARTVPTPTLLPTLT